VGRNILHVLWMLGLLALAEACPGAQISELNLSTRAVLDGNGAVRDLPPLVELADLQGRSHVELLIIDAQNRTSVYGTVRQVIDLNLSAAVSGPAGTGVAVVCEGAWPAGIQPGVPAWTIQPLPGGVHLDLGDRATDSRTLLLLDGPTFWSVNDVFVAGAPACNGARVLDSLTLGPAAAGARPAKSYAGEPILSVADGAAVLRPYLPSGDPWPQSAELSGMPLIELQEPMGYLVSHARVFPLSPGLPNIVADVPHNPEPASGLLLLAGGSAAVLAVRPHRAGNRRPPRKSPHHWKKTRRSANISGVGDRF
jgi:hypothetical protein